MDIGMTIPSMIEGIDRSTLLDWFRIVDQGPFSTLAIGERIAYPNVEMFTTLAAAAAVTERVKLMTTLVVLPAHPTIDVAKKAATIDVLSGGRLELGVGIGGRDEDFRALGAPYDHRHQRMDDQVALMRRVWAGEEPMDDMHSVGPMPVQPGGPPLYAGALAPKAIARAARWADGILGFMLDPLGEDAKGAFGHVEQAWIDAGRSTPPRQITSFWYALGDDGPTRLNAYARRYLGIFGDDVAAMMADMCTASSPAAITDAIARVGEAGCDELIFVPTTADLADLDALATLLA
jgi:alkanesulfonate monooxygenase SsuD/methylene tetrahydromethanopterin reductase-like flavin-dependent oxidoreductase (luciferase family)